VTKARTLFGPYEPDKPPHLTDVLRDMGNAYAGASGYRPVGQFQPVTTALPASFFGAAAFVNSAGNGILLAGTVSGIYRYTGIAWSALASSLTVADRWQFTQFGDLAIAVNGGATRKIDMIGNTIANVPGAPTALCVATVRDFVVYGQANGNASMIQWCGFGNQDDNTPGVNQAGFQPMLTGGYVMGIAGGEYGIIVQRSRVVRMSYTGDPDVPFQFDEISANIGAISRGSIAQAGRLIFFLSDRGFMMCDGNEVKPIGFERVDATFFAANPRSTLDAMYAAIDPRRNAVAWAMPGSPGTIMVYDWALDKWSVIRAVVKGIFSGFSSNLSLDALDALYPGGVDTIPYSFDDPRFAGGDPLFLVVDQTNTVGTFSGSNMAAWFSCPLQEYSQGRTSRVRMARPIGDAVSGVTVTLDARQRLGDAAGSASRAVLNASGQMPVRASGRYIGARMDFAAGAGWAYNQGVEFDIAAGQQR
jgi:hypothetical protein